MIHSQKVGDLSATKKKKGPKWYFDERLGLLDDIYLIFNEVKLIVFVRDN